MPPKPEPAVRGAWRMSGGVAEPLTFLDFDLVIERSEHRYRAHVLASPAGQATHEFDLPFDKRDLRIFVLQIAALSRQVRRIDSPAMKEVKSFGGNLFDAIFDGQVLTCLARSMDRVADRSSGLRIRLRIDDRGETTGVALSDVPWEFLYDASNNSFLSLSDRSPIVRFPDLPRPTEALAVEAPLRILVMISSPGGVPELDVELEWEKLSQAVGDLRQQGLVALERLNRPTLEALQRQLRRGGPYHIFHFIGHGRFNEAAQDGELLFEDDAGKGQPASGEFLAVLLARHPSIRLAVLNACEGGRTSSEDPFAGTAQTLVQAGIPAVIAMQFAITDQSAIEFSKEFYAALVDGYAVDAAVSEARTAIYTRVSPVEWAIPVLYMHSPDGVLFEIRKAMAGVGALEQAERERVERKQRQEEADRLTRQQNQEPSPTPPARAPPVPSPDTLPPRPREPAPVGFKYQAQLILAWIGVVMGFIFYVVPGVFALRHLREWQRGERQSPILPWIIGSITVAMFLITLSVKLACAQQSTSC